MSPVPAVTPGPGAEQPTRTGEAPWFIDPPTGWPAPFDMIQGVLESAWAGIYESIDFLWTNIVDTISVLWTDIVGAFWDQWTAIVGGIDSLWTSILYGFDSLWFNLAVRSLPSWDDIVRGLDDVWTGLVDALGTLWTNIVRAFDDLYHAVCDFLFGIGDWIYARLLETVGHWDPDKQRFVGGFLGWLWDAMAGTLDYFWNLLSGLGSWLTDCFDWLHSEVVGWLVGAMEVVGKAVGDGLQALWSWLSTEVPKFLGGALSFLNEHVIAPIMGALQWVFDRVSETVATLISGIEDLFAGHSPISGEDALVIGVLASVTAAFSGGTITALIDLASTRIVATGLNLQSLGNFVTQLINPQMFIGAVLGVLVGVGIKTPLTQYYNKLFRPSLPAIREAQEMMWRGKISMDEFKDVLAMHGMRDRYSDGFVEMSSKIPPSPDLVRMVVREAFVEDMVIEAPDVFADYLTKSGFSAEWADRYWTAHFTPIALRQAYDNLWRGFWNKEDFMYALHIADIHPMWREDIYNVAFRPPGVRELGYGYDTGMYSVDDIVKYRRMAGLSQEDAEKAGLSMVAYRTEAEREALRREALYDFTDGLDSEGTLRGKLADIGGRPEIVDLWVSRAIYRQNREVKRDIIKVVKNQFVKGWLTDVELRVELTAIGVVPEQIEVHVVESETRRLSYKREETAEKKRNLTEAKMAKAWELGVLGDEEYVSRLVDRNYTEEDARLLLEVLRTPLPITPEEVERRRKSIDARIRRVTRKYEKSIATLDKRAGLLSGDIEAFEIEVTEVLDIIDVQISTIEDEIRDVTPEILTKPILEAIARVRRRYERSLARLDAKSVGIATEIESTEIISKETLDVIDTTIKYVQDELVLLGAAP